jgi:hypothetical protein
MNPLLQPLPARATLILTNIEWALPSLEAAKTWMATLVACLFSTPHSAAV